MEFLGSPWKVFYESKNLVSGLTGITATIIKPDNTTIGPLALTERPEVAFKGVYEVIIPTTVADPKGQWVGVVTSPNEGNYTRAFKASFYDPSTLGGASGSSPGSPLVGIIKSDYIIAKMVGSKINGILKESSPLLSKTNTIKLIAELKLNKLTGLVKCTT